MDLTQIVTFTQGAAYFLVFLGIFIFLSIIKGRQTVMNITVGLYLALLIFIEFPNKEILFSKFSSTLSLAGAKITLFSLISLFTILLCYRIMPDEFNEEKLESMFKKIMLSFGATVLVVLVSFQVLPFGEMFNLGTSLTPVFSPENFFFWWLLLPLVILYIM